MVVGYRCADSAMSQCTASNCRKQLLRLVCWERGLASIICPIVLWSGSPIHPLHEIYVPEMDCEQHPLLGCKPSHHTS